MHEAPIEPNTKPRSRSLGGEHEEKFIHCTHKKQSLLQQKAHRLDRAAGRLGQLVLVQQQGEVGRRGSLEEIKKCPGMTSAGSSPRASYAEVAQTPPTSQADNVRILSSANTTPSTFTDILFCTIDASHVEEAEKGNVTAGTVRSAVEKEMRARKDDGSWRCKAVTVDARNTSRVKVVCRNEEEHNMVKQAAEVATLAMARGVRILRDELYSSSG